jgi:hypothetical protein
MKAAAKKQKTSPQPEDRLLFDGLKAVLAKRAAKLSVKTDQPNLYYLETKSESYHRGGRTMFGCVMQRKDYVSFHLFGLYMNPALLDKMTPDLRKRMVGKTCFKFKRYEPELFRELGGFVDESLRIFKVLKLL